jgi:molybdopterin-guanine dinucleotide biosynthesis protein A
MYDAIILAGGVNTVVLRNMTQQQYEAMIDIAGEPMVAFVARALAASQKIGRILVVGPRQELEKISFPGCVRVLEGGRTVLDTIQVGMQQLGHNHKTLVATADIPLLTVQAVDHFIQQCGEKEADLYYPIVAKEVHNRQYPNNKRTYVQLKEGLFTGGNLFMVKPDVVPQCLEIAERIIANRKSPFQLCRMLGWTFVFRFLCKSLTLAAAEKRVSEVLGITGAVLQTPYPEVGIDVDKPTDLELVRALFAVRL